MKASFVRIAPCTTNNVLSYSWLESRCSCIEIPDNRYLMGRTIS